MAKYPTIQFMRPVDAAGGGIEFQKTDKQINNPSKVNELLDELGADVWFMSEKAHEGADPETLATFLEYTAGTIAFISACLNSGHGR